MAAISPGLAAVLGAELLRRSAEDRRLVTELHAAPAPHRMQLFHRCCRENTAVLKEIVADHGWPSFALVGEKASTAALMIVLHSTHDLAFQEDCRGLVTTAVGDGSSPAIQLAYLDDLCAVAVGEPQPYGTQLDLPTGRPRPIRDQKSLDERRAKVGLGPYADFLQEVGSPFGS